MGLLTACADAMVREHARRPLGPAVLFIGRQTVPLSLAGLNRLLERNGLVNQAPDDVEYDTETRSAAEQRFITDRYFLRALGIPKFHALDVTDYEGADIIHDLGMPIPEEYTGRYDFIYNGSCFDNMFNPGIAMINLSKLLKPHGRMMSIETATSLNSPYLMFSPGWFYDFYVTNRYKRCEVYLGSVTGHDQLFYGPWDVDYVNVPGHRNGPVPVPAPGISHILLAIAEKDDDSTDDRQPIQAQYRTTKEIAGAFDAAEQRIIPSDGKCLLGAVKVGPDAPYLTFIGELGGGLRPEGVAPVNETAPALARILSTVDDERLAGFLGTVARLLKPFSTSKFVQTLDRSQNEMWTRIKRRRRQFD